MEKRNGKTLKPFILCIGGWRNGERLPIKLHFDDSDGPRLFSGGEQDRIISTAELESFKAFHSGKGRLLNRRA